MTDLLATPANMNEYAAPGVFSYSPVTGERYSASAGDYFGMLPDDVLTDAEGEPMILAREICTVVPIEAA